MENSISLEDMITIYTKILQVKRKPEKLKAFISKIVSGI